MPLTRRQAGCPCCGPVSACPITLTISVFCSGVAKSGVTVSITKDDVEVATCTTNSSGVCSVSLDDAPGEYTATATYTHEGVEFTRAWTGELECGDNVTIPLGCTTGVLTGCNGFPLAGQEIELRDGSGTPVGTVVTDSNGRYNFGGTFSKYYLERPPRWVSHEGDVFVFGGNANIGIGGGPGFPSPFVAEGYKCCGSRDGDPIIDCDTINLIDPLGNTVELTRNTEKGCGYTGFAEYIAGDPDARSSLCWDGVALSSQTDFTVRYRWSFNDTSDVLIVDFPYTAPFEDPLFARCYGVARIGTGGGTRGWTGLTSDDDNCEAPFPSYTGSRFGLIQNPNHMTSLPPAAPENGTFTYTGVLGPRAVCGTGGEPDPDGDDFPHPISTVTGWGTTPEFSVTYTCTSGGPPPESMMVMASTTTESPRKTTSTTGSQYLENARNCPHRKPIPDDERIGCGCSHRCDDGRSDKPNGGVTILDCWSCPIAPRRNVSAK